MPTLRTLVPLLTCTLLAACGNGGPAEFRIETLEGVSHSVAADVPENPDATLDLLWTAPPPDELMDGGSWADPFRITADDRGVAVLDPQLSQAHLFSTEGERLLSVGRPGEGPGELQTPQSISFHGDTLMIQGFLRPAIQLFDRSDGTYIGSLGAGGAISPGFFHLRDAGIVRQVAGETGRGAGWSHLPLDDAESSAIELPGTHPLQPHAADGGDGCWRRGTAGRHLVEADCTFPFFRLVDSSGEVVREHRIERDPVLTPEATLARVVEDVEESMRSSAPPDMGAELEQMIQEMMEQQRELYRWRPSIRGVTGSPSGERILLWEQDPAILEPENAVLHVFDAEGRYLQRHAFDQVLAAVALTDDRLYLLVPDPETDLKRLEAYRLP